MSGARLNADMHRAATTEVSGFDPVFSGGTLLEKAKQNQNLILAKGARAALEIFQFLKFVGVTRKP
jgi:hypothetical protein